MVDIDKEVMKGHIDMILLTLISERDMYGYEIIKEINKRSDNLFIMKEGTMYLGLKRLELSNCISSYWSNETSGGGRRKYYKISKTGLQKLLKKQAEWNYLRRVLDSFSGGENDE